MRAWLQRIVSPGSEGEQSSEKMHFCDKITSIGLSARDLMEIIMQYPQRRNLSNEALADILYLLKSVMPSNVGKTLPSNFSKLQEILLEDLKVQSVRRLGCRCSIQDLTTIKRAKCGTLCNTCFIEVSLQDQICLKFKGKSTK